MRTSFHRVISIVVGAQNLQTSMQISWQQYWPIWNTLESRSAQSETSKTVDVGQFGNQKKKTDTDDHKLYATVTNLQIK